jgi:peptidoglycan hydrolase-like protein with peptidoglycan-binding domain
MLTKLFRTTLIPLSVASVFAIAPMFIGNSPANAQIVVDGSLREYRPSTAPSLKYGARGAVVRDLQVFLRNRGYYFGRTDGIYGYRTDRAVRNFQYANRLRTDGIVGRNTWRILSNRSQYGGGLFN